PDPARAPSGHGVAAPTRGHRDEPGGGGAAAGVVDFYPVPHRDRAEPPPARERTDPSRAVRRDRSRTGRADPADPGGPPARVVALVPRRAAEPVRGLHRPGSRRRLDPQLRAHRRTWPPADRGLRSRDLPEWADRAGP